MVGGKEKLYVTCSSRSFSRSIPEGIFPALFLRFFLYKMTLDDESDQSRGEVSLRRDYRDETFISTIHAFLIILCENSLPNLKGADHILPFR